MSISMLSELSHLNKQQWSTCTELERLQLIKLRRQLQRAYNHTRFYKECFDAAGIRPEDIRSLSDLRHLPVVTKAEIVAAGESIYADDINKKTCVWMKTSGSSGSPLCLPFTRRDKDHRALKELRALMSNGYKFTDKMLIFVEPRCVVKHKSMMQKLGLVRRDYMSIYDSTDEQINRIRTTMPEVIYGYTSTLRILAESLASSGTHIRTPKILMSAAELLDTSTRKIITDGLGIEPVDFYGSMEFGWIAWQCKERQGYHINSDCLITECLNNGRAVRDGEEGELVITNLHSDAAPLIRYVTGDTVSFAERECKCGSALPLISAVNGRVADCVVLRGGRKLSPYVVTCAIEDIPGIRQFQIIQDQDGTVNVNLLKSRYVVDTERVRIAVETALGSNERVVVQLTSNLQLEPTGKFRVVKSFAANSINI